MVTENSSSKHTSSTLNCKLSNLHKYPSHSSTVAPSHFPSFSITDRKKLIKIEKFSRRVFVALDLKFHLVLEGAGSLNEFSMEFRAEVLFGDLEKKAWSLSTVEKNRFAGEKLGELLQNEV